MAAYTTSQSGNWNDAATWGGGGYPTTGDTATIATGHTVTIPVSTTSTSGAVTFNSGTGKLIVNGTWNLGGNVTLNGGGNIIEANGAFVIDLNGYTIAVTATGVAYNFLGTELARGTVQSTTSAGSVTTSGTVQVIPTFTYVDFNGIGDARWGRSQSSNSTISWQYCTFTGCGNIDMDIAGAGVNSGFILRGCSFINPSTADPEASNKYQPYIYTTTAGASTAYRVVEDCYWETNGSNPNLIYIRAYGTIFRRNVFDNVILENYEASTSFYNNFFKNDTSPLPEFFRASGGGSTLGTFVGNYCYYEADWHPFGRADTLDGNVYGNVLDNEDGTAAVNWILDTGNTTYKVLQNLTLGPGIMVTYTVSTAPTLMDVSRNTFYGANSSGDTEDFPPFVIAEQTATLTGTVKVQSNLYCNPDTTTLRWHYLAFLLNNTANQIDSATHNYCWGYPGGSHTPTYDPQISPAPGANDGSVDPQFFEKGRNLRTWCLDRGYGTATVADAVAAVKEDTTRISDLVSYCFEGYKTQNATLRTAARDGGQVGAATYHNSSRNISFITSLHSDVDARYGVSVSGPF